MPIYDYVCRSCGHVLEVIHGVHEAGPTTCPQCGGEMRKALSTPAIVFKGSGWAKKDARRNTAPPAAKKADDSSSSAKPAAGDSSPSPKPSSPATEAS